MHAFYESAFGGVKSVTGLLEAESFVEYEIAGQMLHPDARIGYLPTSMTL